MSEVEVRKFCLEMAYTVMAVSSELTPTGIKTLYSMSDDLFNYVMKGEKPKP